MLVEVVVAIATGCKSSVATTHTNAKDNKDHQDLRALTIFQPKKTKSTVEVAA